MAAAMDSTGFDGALSSTSMLKFFFSFHDFRKLENTLSFFNKHLKPFDPTFDMISLQLERFESAQSCWFIWLWELSSIKLLLILFSNPTQESLCFELNLFWKISPGDSEHWNILFCEPDNISCFLCSSLSPNESLFLDVDFSSLIDVWILLFV